MGSFVVFRFPHICTRSVSTCAGIVKVFFARSQPPLRFMLGAFEKSLRAVVFSVSVLCFSITPAVMVPSKSAPFWMRTSRQNFMSGLTWIE